MERSNGSTAPSARAGRTHGSTDQRPNAAKHSPAGCTFTITTEPTPPSEPHSSADSPPAWTSHSGKPPRDLGPAVPLQKVPFSSAERRVRSSRSILSWLACKRTSNPSSPGRKDRQGHHRELVIQSNRTRGAHWRLQRRPDTRRSALAVRQLRQVREHLCRVSHELLDELRLTQPIQLLG